MTPEQFLFSALLRLADYPSPETVRKESNVLFAMTPKEAFEFQYRQLHAQVNKSIADYRAVQRSERQHRAFGTRRKTG